MTDDPTEAPDLDAMRRHLDAADAAVDDMCTGSGKWRMTVPVDFKRDHDVRIGAALADLRALIEETRDD